MLDALWSWIMTNYPGIFVVLACVVIAWMLRGRFEKVNNRIKKCENHATDIAEPFNEDVQQQWSAIGSLYRDGVISLETAIQKLGLAPDRENEIQRIKLERSTSSSIQENITVSETEK